MEWVRVEWARVVLQSVVAFAALFLFVRILGKKQISQLTYFEYVMGVAMGSVAAFGALESEGRWWHAPVSLAVLFVASIGKEYAELRSRRARRLLSGRGTVLIRNGRVLEDNLKKERYTLDDLKEQLRQKSVFNLADVKLAVLETTGELSVLRREKRARSAQGGPSGQPGRRKRRGVSAAARMR